MNEILNKSKASQLTIRPVRWRHPHQGRQSHSEPKNIITINYQHSV